MHAVMSFQKSLVHNVQTKDLPCPCDRWLAILPQGCLFLELENNKVAV